MPSKYSESDIARLAGQDYKSLSSYEKRLVRGHERGLTRSQSRGHARTKFGELPLSQRPNTPKLAKGTGKIATVKPVLPVSQRKKVKMRHVQPIYRKSDTTKSTPIGKAINARTQDSLHKQLDKLPDSAGVLFHVKDTRRGEDIRVVGKNKGNTIKVGDLKRSINSRVSQGYSWDEAFDDALIGDFDAYGDDSEEADSLPASPTNYVAYVMY